MGGRQGDGGAIDKGRVRETKIGGRKNRTQERDKIKSIMTQYSGYLQG